MVVTHAVLNGPLPTHDVGCEDEQHQGSTRHLSRTVYRPAR